MARPPLPLSAHPSAWDDAADPEHRPGLAAVCRFCGEPTAGWQARFHLDGDHAHNDPGNLVTACPLCHLAQHLNRPEIDREAQLIWLPEMTQGALNLLVRHIHLACRDAGVSPALPDAPPSRMPRQAFGAFAAWHAVRERQAAAELRLGTTSPRALGAALLDLSPMVRATLPARLSGIRLLPRGQLFRAGRDIYPEILSAWAAERRTA
jgi:intracellular multiplication protein IcmJ